MSLIRSPALRRIAVRAACLGGLAMLLGGPPPGLAEGARTASATPRAGLDGAEGLEFLAGLALFDKLWVSSPSSTLVSDGLGPLYNARSCASCHPGGGAAALPDPGAVPLGLVVRLSVPGPNGPAPDPVYGRQLQIRGIAGHAAEAEVQLDWSETEIALSGGETARLRSPVLRLSGFAYGAPDAGLMTSARLAPRLQGLGLVDALAEAAILASEDPQDRDGDGISGRAGRDAEGRLGRFGWKAQQADLRHQAAAAFADDIGLSSGLRPGGWGDCTMAQESCRKAPDGAGPEGVEVSELMLDLVAGFTRDLAAPPPAPNLPAPALPSPALPAPAKPGSANAGAALFDSIGCGLCHLPRLGRGPDAPAVFSDFLLHDMGPGLADPGPQGLADPGPQGLAEAAEWRTAPLWGMSSTGSGDPPAQLLHDGRARSPLEAILWHDGEARPMRDAVVALPPQDRAALIRFLESL